MAQTDFGTIDPATKSGTALATDLNDWRDSVHSSHSGSSAPSYLVEGMQWYDTDTNVLSTYNGTSWGEMFNFTSGVAMDGVVIGSTTPAAGTFTTGTITTADINGGNIDGTVIGGTTPAAATFTSVTTSDEFVAEVVAFGPNQNAPYLIAATPEYTGAITDPGTYGIQHRYKFNNGGTARITVDTSIGGVETEVWSLDNNGNMTVLGTLTTSDEVVAKVVGYAAGQEAPYMIAATSVYTGAATNPGTYGMQHRYKFDGGGTPRITVDTSIGGVETEVWSLDNNGNMSLLEGQLAVNSAGSESAPDYAFVGDTDTGMFQSTGDTFGVTCGGAAVTYWSSGELAPATDNTTRLGNAIRRWDDIYLVNSPTVTSDINLKTDIVDLNEAETRVAQAVKGLLRRYRWKDGVASRGDGAKYHFGVMAQEVVAAFDAEGLDAHDYGMICLDDTEDGGQRYGVRYSELLAFMIAAM